MLAERGAGDSVFLRGTSDCGVAAEVRPLVAAPGELRVGEARKGEGPPLAPPTPALESPSACTRRQRLPARRCLAGLGPPVAAVSARPHFCSHGSSATCISMQQSWGALCSCRACDAEAEALHTVPEWRCFVRMGLLAAAVYACCLHSHRRSSLSRFEPRSHYSYSEVSGASCLLAGMVEKPRSCEHTAHLTGRLTLWQR